MTLLAQIRTGLYFLVAGSTLRHVVESEFWNIASTPLIVTGLAIMLLGVVRYFRLRKSVEASEKNIGNSTNFYYTWSDIAHLTWDEIKENKVDGWYLHFKQRKDKTVSRFTDYTAGKRIAR